MSGGDKTCRFVARYAVFSVVSMTGTALAAVILAPTTAYAQTASAEQKSFNIPAQSLADALALFGQQSGLQVTTQGALPEGRRSAAVSGELTPAEALSRLLTGTGLTFRFDGSDAVRLEAAPQSAGGAIQLGPVRVEGADEGRGYSASGDVPPAYAGGQVASGGRVGFLGNKDFMETPFNVTAYTEKFIDDRQAQDITAVIAATDPAVFNNGITGAWSENYSIRGFASSSSDMTFGGLFGLTPYYRTTPEMFERVEVLKGPSALLNGIPPGGSVGGTVNLVPKRAGDEPLTRLTATYMSDAQFGGHIDIGRRFGESKQFGIRLNGVYRDGEGAVNSQEKKTQLASLALDFRGERVRLSTDLYISDDRVDGVIRGINLAAGVAVPKPPKPKTLLNPDWSFVHNKDRGAIVRGEFDVSDQLTAYAGFGTSRSNYKYNGAVTAQVFNAAGDFRTVIGQLAFEVDKKSGEAGLKGEIQTGGIGHQLAMNVTYYSDHVQEFGRRSVPGADTISNIYNPVWGSAAAFIAPAYLDTKTRLVSYGIADTLSFAQDRVQLTLGVRRQEVRTDTFNVTTGARSARYDAGATSPAVALLVKATNNISVYGNYIQGLSKGQTAPLTSANAGELFPPYKTEQMEFGVKFDFGEFANTLSVYQIKRPNSYTDIVTNIFSFGGEQRNRGAEWSFFGSPVKGLRLMGGVAYVEPKVTRATGGVNQGKQATGVPKWQGKLGVEWDVPPAEGLTLTANATAVSKQFISADNSLVIPGRTVFDLGARYATSIASQPLTLRANVTNVTNKAYWGMPLLSSLGLGAPRTFQLSASIDF